MKRILLSALLVGSSCALMGQSSASTPASRPEPAVPVTLGHSVVALTGPWKFHIGDNPQWADPGLDDSGWQPYELISGPSPLTPDQITRSAELPGWQQHGHPGYTGYAWYRIRLQLPRNLPSLALLMPQDVDDAYEVYVNGSKIGGFGNLNGWQLIYSGQPQIFSLPAAALGSGQPVTFALRFWSSRDEAAPDEHNLDGGLRGLPVIGPSSLLRILEQSERQQTWESQPQARVDLLVAALYVTVGVISLFLFLFSRGQKEYLWAGISLTGFGAMIVFIVLAEMQQTMIPAQLCALATSVAYEFAVFAMPLAAMYLLSVPRPLWRRADYLVSALNLAWVVQNTGFSLGLLPPTASVQRIDAVTVWLAIPLLACLLLAIAVDGVRTIGRKAWLPMTPGMLFAVYCNLYLLYSFGIIKGGFLFPSLISACVPIAVLIIFLMRFTQQQRENVRLADDMRQAREVQQLMIPEKSPRVSWLEIESEYLPAREVGGDFFQIIPAAADDGVLVVAGDVTGHGLQAGMLVAMLVGAIRTESAHTSDPVTILKVLNARLYGREHAQATCLVLRIESGGNATLANAGHLPPYLNGRALEIEGALPLGMMDGAEFSVMRFRLSESDRLVMISDGVVEARNAKGELFGFDRTAAISAKSADQIAHAAKQFGQKDDITVLTLTRVQEAIHAAW
ncbi:MAG: SpoIIE family protein phosphatase [Acidobacteriaceae bacterium]